MKRFLFVALFSLAASTTGCTSMGDSSTAPSSTPAVATATENDPKVWYAKGVDYRDGVGVSKDYAEAAKWFLKAAEAGNADGQTMMTGMYLLGMGVTPNLSEAVKWSMKAADQGHAQSVKVLLSVGKDKVAPTALAEQLRLNAEAGSPTAQTLLAALYAGEKLLPGKKAALSKDNVQAYVWVTRAAAGYKQAGNTEREQTLLKQRESIKAKMSRRQIAEAEALVVAWKTPSPQNM